MKLGGRVASFVTALAALAGGGNSAVADDSRTTHKPSSSAVGSFAIGPQRFYVPEWVMRGEKPRMCKAEIQRRRNGGR